MPIKLIAFDLDDTLLRDDLTVGKSDLDAIAKAYAEGTMIVPASGRRFNSMLQTLQAMHHVGPVVTLNGAKVIQYPSGEALYERYVPVDLCIEAAQAAKEMGGYLQLYMEEDFEYATDCPESELYTKLSGGGGVAVGDLESYLLAQNRPSQKLLIIEQDKDKMQALQDHMSLRFAGRLSVFRSKSFYLEMTHLQATKGAALAHLCTTYGILPQEVMAMGDGENDLSMLDFAGVGVAVANASQSIRKRVDCVTLSNMHGGVGEAIRKYALA